MKALVTLAFVVEVDSPAEAEEIRDVVDRSVWHAVADVLAQCGVSERELDGLLEIYPAGLSLERSKA